MKLIIKTIHTMYEIIITNNIISSNTLIEKISELEKVDIHHIIIFYNNNIIKYSINEIYIEDDCSLFILITPTNV